jgi:hypothetical protein
MARTGKKSRWWYLAKGIHSVETGHPKRLKAKDCPKCQRIMEVWEKADAPMETAEAAA